MLVLKPKSRLCLSMRDRAFLEVNSKTNRLKLFNKAIDFSSSEAVRLNFRCHLCSETLLANAVV